MRFTNDNTPLGKRSVSTCSQKVWQYPSQIFTTGETNTDLQDLQDDRRSDLQHGEITEKIIGCAFEVINELGAGFLESVDENAMAIAFQESGFRVQFQQALPVHFRQRIVGEFFADLVVDGLCIHVGNPKLEYERFTRHK